MFKIKLLIIAVFCCTVSVSAQSQFKVMFYNLLNYPNETTFPNRDVDLATILSTYQPDLLMVCEVNNENGANQILNIAQNSITVNYASANFVTNSSDDLAGDNNELQNMLYYDSSKFTLEFQTEIPTLIRYFNHYRLKLKTENQESDPIYLEAFVGHLKASFGIENENIRSQQALDLMAYISTLPTDSYVIFGGDLNLYTAFESAFQVLLDNTYPITLADPPNRVGQWSNNPEFLDVFTQSTRIQSNLGGAAGGFDDRFDFILTSENLLSNSDLHYVEDSYQVFGNNNNSNCYNRAINDDDCSGDLFNLSIRQALHDFSDHLPVTITLETPLTLGLSEFESTTTFAVINTFINNGLLLINTSDYSNLVMVNSLGQIVNYYSLPQATNIAKDVSNLNSGVYWLMDNTNKNVVVKLIISN
jgi:hypothetical protein